MASKIILKKSSVAAKAPVAADLEFGELALNYTDSKLYFKKADGTTIDAFTGSAASGTVTSVGLTSGTGISVSGSPITTSGNITVTNTAPNVTTDISTTHNATTVVVNSSDGTDGTINAATTSLAGVMTGADKTKLDGIAAGATNVTNNNQLTNGAGYITSAALASYLPLSGGTLSGDLQLNENYLRFNQSGTRSWNMRATGGNLDLSSGDGVGSFRYNGGVILTSNNVSTYALPQDATFSTAAAADIPFIFRKTSNGTNNGATLLVQNDYGSHSWGITGEFRVTGASDRPSILFSSDQTSTTWSVGYGYMDDQFRINQNHGHRNGSWGTERFRIDTSGNAFANVSMRSPIFYDSNDTGYYGDFASTSNLNALNVNSLNVGDGNLQLYKSQTVDLSNTSVYSESNFYPVIINVPISGVWIEVQNNLNSNVPTWSTHPGGFTLNLRWCTNASGWGTTEIKRRVEQYHERFTNQQICGGISQLGHSSNEVVWLRGGGSYFFKFSRNLTAVPQSSNYTIHDQTADVRTTAFNSIWDSATGAHTSYNTRFYADTAIDSPIYYDRNDTAYYVDPNSTSNLAGLTVANAITASITGNAASITNQANSATITASTGVTGSHIVQRDGNGYIYANHINFNTTESENPTISSFITSNGDGWSRKSTLVHVKNSIRGVADGTWSINITGNAATATTATSADQIDSWPFRNTGNNSATNADTIESNGITYYTSGVTNFSGNASDGALYSQAYSSSWQHQIAGDYRSGQIAVRGKNSGTWQAWRKVLQEDTWQGNKYFSSDGAIYGTIFYDTNNSAYYVDPSSSSTSFYMNGGMVTTAPGGSVLMRHLVSEVDAWLFMENAANWGLYWKNNPSGNHTFGGYTSIGAELFGMSAVNSSGNGVLTSNFVGATSAYAQWMLSNYTGYIWSASTITAAGDMRAPIFYDSNNTSYYVDPAGASVSACLNGPIVMSSTDWTGEVPGKIQYHSNNWYLQYSSYFHFRRADGGNTFYGDSSGNTWSIGSSRAPIFYDSDNTGYYVDPNSTSNLAGLTVAGTISGNISGSADHLRTAYAGGQQTNPQVYFNENIGLKVAMTGVPNVWSDTLWINGYAGADVPNMCALHTIRNGTPRMWISSQSNRATAYGAMYEFLTEYNYNNYSPTLTGGGASGTWNINITGTAGGETLATVTSRGASTGTALTLSSGGNQYNGHFYYLAYDSAGNHYPHFNDGGNASGSKVNWRLFTGGTNSVTHYWGTDTALFNTKLESSSRVDAPIFYDRNDTGYYIDPNTTGTSIRVAGYAYFGLGIDGDGVIINHDQIWTPTGNFHIQYSGSGNVDMNYGGGYTFSRTSLRAPVFYDYDDTSYYVNPNSTSYLYNLTLAGGGYFQPNNWIQFNGSYGLYWPNHYGAHLHANDLSSYTQIALRGSKGGYGGIYDQASAVNIGMFDGSGNGGVYREANGRWFSYYSVANDCWGFGSSNTSPSYNLYVSKGLYSGGRVDGTIFYDSNDNGYYLDPNSTSNLYNLQLIGAKNTYLYINPGNGYEAMVRYNGGSGSGWYVGKRISSNLVGTESFHFYSEAAGATVGGVDTGGNMFASGSHRAPIFYDSADTSYYVDPNSYSRIRQLTLTQARVDSSKYPVGHYTPGEEVFAIDPTWTQDQIREYFNSNNVSWVADSTAPGGYAISITGSITAAGGLGSGFPFIPVETDDTFYMEVYIKNVSGSNGHYMGSIDFNENFSNLGGNPGSYGYWVMSNSNPGTGWTKYSGYISGFGTATGTFKSGTKYWSPQALFNYTGGGTSYISGWKVVKLTRGIVGRFPNSTTNTGEAWYGRANDRNSGTYTIQLGGGSSSGRQFEVVDYAWSTVMFSVASDNYASAAGSFRAPVFYDSNDTGYYVDPNSTSRQYQINFNNLYYAPDTNYGFIGTSIYVDTINSGYANDPLELNYVRGTWVGISHDSLRAPLYYDYNDTGYYIDPNSTSDSALRMRGGALFGPNTTWGASLYVGGNGRVGTSATVAVTNGNLHIDSQNGYSLYLNWYNTANIYTQSNLGVGSDSASYRLHVHGTGYATSDFRAPIFYDANDTGYYLDPNDTSRLNYLRPNRISIVGNQDNGYPRWDFKAYVVESQHHYGQTSTQTMYLGEDNYIYIRSIGEASGSFRAPIFYDSNNTGYYVDPNTTGTSINVAGSITAGGNVTAYSDESLKTDWAGLPSNYVEQLASLLSGTFTRKDTGERQAGVGAQSLQKILPETVFEGVHLSVAYGNAAMVSAVELAKRVVEQDARIAKLEERLSKLLDD